MDRQVCYNVCDKKIRLAGVGLEIYKRVSRWCFVEFQIDALCLSLLLCIEATQVNIHIVSKKSLDTPSTALI